MEGKICPYPGLRPFTEEESIFFKGRESHVRQIIEKLEKKKILVITGASGDGKSSMVYAGVIPNARAGFFRAKYNNWLIADFRPERSPLRNLAQNLSAHLELDFEYVHEQLSYGFSAIIDLYKESKFYIDKESDDWKNATEKQRKERKLKASNLFILADQFEEFFTNTENFNDGKASVNAYTTVNLLLETGRLAFEQDLPIYIVCTMRSDFISQSVAFRGLPECIGFSQFFVPRLNRSELQQVIEEPAMLSGGKISKRLIEVLINELREGFDQLPVLQHTLNMLWKMANNGEDEMDLIHLAKLAGLKPEYLSEEDREEFNNWLFDKKGFRIEYFESASLANVLNSHANILYETAFDYYNNEVEWAKGAISKQDAKLIIKKAFQSLTKIDEGRAVRNRMSLQDIKNIIDLPHINYETVCGVLNIFRLQDSTFLRPFIDENDIDTQYLSSDTVLDITHEALIRNWDYLKQWDEEEFEHLMDFQDFKIQLQRWLNNGKSNDYLLTSGSLAHFEEWYDSCKPNKHWIAKYDNSSHTAAEKLLVADELADNTHDFLELSRQHLISIEKAKQRRRRLYASVAGVVFVVLSGFTYWALKEKANAEEKELIAEKQQKIAEEKSKIAEEKTIIAEREKNRAITANELAEQEKLRAEENARVAIVAKQQSDRAKREALKQKKIAEQNSILAQEQADLARREKEKADEQRSIAEKQKLVAEKASNEAKKLSYLAIAQSLTFEATEKYDDKELNLLLALQAYNFHTKYDGKKREPSLYEALRFSLENYDVDNKVPVTKERISSIYFNQNGILHAFCKNGELVTFNINDNSNKVDKKAVDTDIPINSSFFISDDHLVVCYEDKSIHLLDFTNNKNFSLVGHKDFVRAAGLHPNGEMFATAGRDKSILLWDLTKPGKGALQSKKFDTRITALDFADDGKFLIAGGDNGEIFYWDLSTNEEKTISQHKSRVLSLAISPDNHTVAVGFSDGLVRLLLIDEDFKNPTDFFVSDAAVEKLAIDNKSELLAAATADRKIRVYALKDSEETPIIMDAHDQKTKVLLFYEDKLFGLGLDNKIRFWENKPEVYADEIRKRLNRNFTKDEWKTFVGENIEYEKTK
jgi:hypothetical protein